MPTPKNRAQSAAAPAPSQDEISRRATTLWENYGRPHGRDLEIWLEAERQLLGVDKVIEGRGNTSVLAVSFDEATAGGKPRSRSEKPVSAARKSESASVRSSL